MAMLFLTSCKCKNCSFKISYRQWYLPFPFCLPSDELEWINQFFFNSLTKTNKLKFESDIKLVGSQCLLEPFYPKKVIQI